jgi:WD40 repeat protein
MNLVSSHSLQPPEFDSRSPCAWAYSPDNRFFACGYLGGRVTLWTFEGERKATIVEFIDGDRRSAHLAFQDKWSEPIKDIVISPNSTLIASANHGEHGNRTVKVWRVEDHTLQYVLTGLRYWILAVAFSPDSQYLAVSGDDRIVRLFNATNGKELHHSIGKLPYSVSSLAFSPDVRYLVIGCDGCLIVVWDMGNYHEACRIKESHIEWTNSLAFSAHGPLFVSGGEDGTVKLWNAMTGQLERDYICPHPDVDSQAVELSRGAFSQDGGYVAGAAIIQGTSENIIVVWHAGSGGLWQYIKQPQRGTSVDYASMIRFVAFCDDTHWLVTGDSDCTLNFWDLEQ